MKLPKFVTQKVIPALIGAAIAILIMLLGATLGVVLSNISDDVGAL